MIKAGNAIALFRASAMRYLTVIIAVALLLGARASWSQGEVAMTGPELEACSAALATFKRDQAKVDIKNYHISVKERPNEFEITFIPNQPPYTRTGSRRITLGGSTIYGPVVYYFVSKDKYQILRKSFAR